MSSRVLRDDLWTSEPIEQLHDKTFRLYVCLLNAADDYGLVETGFGHICRAGPLRRWTVEEVQKMLGELTDAEVILPYSVAGKGYAAIDKWQAFIRAMKPRCPMPSFGMKHVRMPFGFKSARVRESAALILKHLDIKGTTPGMTQGMTGDDLGHDGLRELGVGKKGRREKEEKNSPRAQASWPCPLNVSPEAWAAWLEVRKRLKSPMTEFAYKRAANQLAIWASTGHNPDAIVAASAANGWKGLFEPKTKPVEKVAADDHWD